MNPDLRELLAKAQRALAAGRDSTEINRAIAIATKGTYKDVASLEQAVRDVAAMELPPLRRGSRAIAAGEGLTLGHLDEIAGGIAAATGGDYKAARDAVRQQYEEYKVRRPGEAAIAEIGGGVLLPGAVGVARKVLGGAAAAPEASGILRTLMRGAGLGAADAAVNLIGHADELGDLDPVEFITQSAIGAGVGGGVGLATNAIMALGTGGYGVLRDFFAPEFSANVRARRTLLKSFTESGLSSREARAVLDRMEQARPGMSVPADLSGRMAREARASVNLAPRVGDRAEEFLAQRAAGAGERLAEDLTQAAGFPQGANRVAAREAAVGARRAFADEAYGALEQMYPGNIDDPRLLRVFADDDIANTMRRIRPQAGKKMDFGSLQHTLQELRDEASAAYRAGRGNAAVRWEEKANALEEAMEEVFPGYRAVNRGYAQHTATINAFDQGWKATHLSPSELRKLVRDIEQRGGREAADAFRLGYTDRLAQRMRDATSPVRVARNSRSRTMAVFGEGRQEQYRTFAERVQLEDAFARTRRNVVGNSTTARQLRDAQQQAAGGVMAGARSGGLVGAAAGGLESMQRMLLGDIAEQTAERVGGRLLSPNQAEDFFSAIERAQRAKRGGDMLFDLFRIGLPASAGGYAATRRQ